MTKLTYEEYKEKKLSNPHFTEEFDTPRKLENALKKGYEEYSQLYNLPLVKKIVVNLPYKSNRTWGNIVSGGEAEITYVNGTRQRVDGLKASGTGYNKGLHILDNILNDYARQNILDYEESLYKEYASKPRYSNQYERLYGLAKYGDGNLYYSVGGTGDYFNFIVEKTADLETFTQYTVTFRNGATGKMYAHKVVAPRKKRASPAKKCPVRVDFRKML